MGEEGQAHAQMAALKTSVGEADIEVLKAHQEFREAVLGELREAEAELVKVLQQRIAAADMLRRTTITAPADGRVLNLAVHTAGGVVAPGASILEIVPTGDKLVVLAEIRPGDVGKIHAGESVHIRLSAFKARTTPTIDGEVLSVSADRVSDEKSGAHFVARVALPRELPAAFKNEPLKPGMPAEVFVRVGEQTAIGWLLRPLTDAFARTFRED
jgi:HlyD family type I secretion membrane fusion protein